MMVDVARKFSLFSLNRAVVRALVALGFVVAGGLFVYQLRHALREAPANASWSTYKRVDWWILSARCTQVRKALLVVCGPQGQLSPIEDVSPTDDRGHGLVANLVALFQSRPFDKTDMVRINVWINAAGIAFLSLVFFLCGMPWASILCLAVGAQYGIPGPMASADAQATFFGEYCLILVPIPWVVQLASPQVSAWRFRLAGGLGLAALVAAILLREAIGLIGIACTGFLVAATFATTYPKSIKMSRFYIGIFMVLLLSLASNSMMLSVRNHWLGLPPAHLISSHGIAHAFHQGLGTEANPWGIEYGDRNGAEAVMKVNPNAVYGTPDYYREIGRLYLNIVKQYPGQVALLYGRKLIKTLSLPLRFCGVSIFWYALGVLISLPFLFKTSESPSVSLRTTAALGITLGAFLMQGVLILPSPVFLYPAKFGVLLLLIGLADEGMRRLSIGAAPGLPGHSKYRRATANP